MQSCRKCCQDGAAHGEFPGRYLDSCIATCSARIEKPAGIAFLDPFAPGDGPDRPGVAGKAGKKKKRAEGEGDGNRRERAQGR